MCNPRQRAKDLAAEYAARNDALGWFDRLYEAAAGDASTIPWADLKPNPHFVQWAESHGLTGDDGRRKALVCGCGLGDDAEALSTIGFDVTAFDISPAAIEWARRRFPASRVHYVTQNLLELPQEWSGRFDFIFEAYTLQVLPAQMQSVAMKEIARVLAPNGTLLIVARGRDDDASRGENLPWPLSRKDLSALRACGLTESSFDDFLEEGEPPIRRFRVLYRREAQ